MNFITFLKRRNFENRSLTPREFDIFIDNLSRDAMAKLFYDYLTGVGIDGDKFNNLKDELKNTRFGNDMALADIVLISGLFAESIDDRDFAVLTYKSLIDISLGFEDEQRKRFFVKATLKLSKVEFMRGIATRETLSLQYTGLDMVTDDNRSIDDMILLMYAGIYEHFNGNMSEGAEMRKKAISEMDFVDTSEYMEELAPLFIWNYYLLGDLKETIGFYETKALILENQNNKYLFTFIYPPIIFSYFFMGEHNMAISVGKRIAKHAKELKDQYALNLINSSIGRAYIYSGKPDEGEKIIREALSDANAIDYGWGKYYALVGLSLYELKKGELSKSRDYIDSAVNTAIQYGFKPINASPFILDVLKAVKDQGLRPIRDFDYEEKVNEHINSKNIHMMGVSLRHRALMLKEEGASPGTVISELKKSIQLLSQSGDFKELSISYINLSLLYLELKDNALTSKYANIAWGLLKENEYNEFPAVLIEYVDLSGRVDLDAMLKSMLLDMNHLMNGEHMAARLTTSLSRVLDMEKGAFAYIANDNILIRFRNNIEIHDEKDGSYKRAINEMESVRKSLKISVSNQRHYSNPNLKIFSICIPIIHNGILSALLYLESNSQHKAISDDDLKSLEAFIGQIAQSVAVASTSVVLWQTNDSMLLGENYKGAFCESIDSTVIFIEEQVRKVSKTNLPVLIVGETGVGKEKFANDIFKQSNFTKSYVKVNCGAIPSTIIESELFGYEKGAFTGAVNRKKGYFELANGGTLFMDEIGELPLLAQVKLLRVLQEHEFMRVGGMEAIKVDFRLIAATNRDLEEEVKKGNFRQDLFYRLNVIQLKIPPLRERKSDIRGFSEFFVKKYCSELNKQLLEIDYDTEENMANYPWPGNIRELENVIHKAVLFSDKGRLKIDLSSQEKNSESQLIRNDTGPKKDLADFFDQKEEAGRYLTLEEMEKEYIKKVIESCNGKISGEGGAAKILGLPRTTLISKMSKLGIR